MGNFYRQNTNNPFPSDTGTYTDFAVQKDGSLYIADIDGNWKHPINFSNINSYVYKFSDSDWILDAQYKLYIPESQHMRGAECIISALFEDINNDTYQQISVGTYKENLSSTEYRNVYCTIDNCGNINIYSPNPFNGMIYIDRTYVTPSNTGLLMNVWMGSLDQYNNSTHDPETLYLITE